MNCKITDPLFCEPFYTHPCSEVTEDHARQVIVHQYVACIKIPNQWAVPADDQTVRLDVPALVDIVVGSYLWNPTYGYFLVTAFDKIGQKIQLQTAVGTGNAEPGTVVAGCTSFLICNPVAASAVFFETTFNWNPLPIADDAIRYATVPLIGAKLGDYAQASFTADMTGLLMCAMVPYDDAVIVTILNKSGGSFDLPLGTLRVKVQRPSV